MCGTDFELINGNKNFSMAIPALFYKQRPEKLEIRSIDAAHSWMKDVCTAGREAELDTLECCEIERVEWFFSRHYIYAYMLPMWIPVYVRYEVGAYRVDELCVF